MPVDPSIIGKFNSFADYQRANQEFEQRKALQQAQIMQAQAQAVKLSRPEQMTPYQAATLALQEKALNQKETPQWQMMDSPEFGKGQKNLRTGEFKPLAAANKADAAVEAKIKGKQEFEDSLANLATRYTKLKELGGITSVNDGGLSNAGAAMSASGVGQSLGGLFGTKEQSERNKIAGEVPLLTQSIKNATGMSAQQMNSNVELQTFLKSLGDPKNDYESNMEIIKNLSKKFGTGEVAGAYGGGNDPLASARDAIAKGAPRDAVIKRLLDNGVSAEGL